MKKIKLENGNEYELQTLAEFKELAEERGLCLGDYDDFMRPYWELARERPLTDEEQAEADKIGAYYKDLLQKSLDDAYNQYLNEKEGYFKL